MSVLVARRRGGAYHDSIVLMELQAELLALEGISDAAVVLATTANLELLAASELLPPGMEELRADDLLMVVKAGGVELGEAALDRLERLLAERARSRRDTGGEEGFRPRRLESALDAEPAATWVLVSVPGRFAGDLARQSLERGRNVFLYSDNVDPADELSLKRLARERGILLLGPDCGTTIVGGVGFGFANRVRPGGIGLVAASGTGAQVVSSLLHALGSGVSQLLGTGGRDLSAEIGGIASLQALDLLARDPGTEVIVLVSKLPAPEVAVQLLQAAETGGKPVVVCFLGESCPLPRRGNLHFARSLSEAASLAIDVEGAETDRSTTLSLDGTSDPRGYLRALFSGGTLAQEATLVLRSCLQPLYGNLGLPGMLPLEPLGSSRGHTVLDLGADELTRGRPHPMIDGTLRRRRLEQELADPEVGVLLLDVVLGELAHPDPATELAPVLAEARRRELEVVIVLVGTVEDPQELERQEAKLAEAGAEVFTDPSLAWRRVARVGLRPPLERFPEVPLEVLERPEVVVSVGLETFAASLAAREVRTLAVDWRPPAGGDERLMSILERMRG